MRDETFFERCAGYLSAPVILGQGYIVTVVEALAMYSGGFSVNQEDMRCL